MATYDREAEAARFSGEAQTALYLATALEVSRRRIGSSSVRGCESAPRAQVGALSVGGLVAAQMIDVTGIIAASSLALAGVRASSRHTFRARLTPCTLPAACRTSV